MTNPYISYYVNQVGSGISHYHGVKYQRGRGFFSTLWQKALLPFLKTASRETLKTTLGVAGDVAAGKDIKESAKQRFSKTGRHLGSMVLKKGQDYLEQDGSGKRRKAVKRRNAASTSSLRLNASPAAVAQLAKSVHKAKSRTKKKTSAKKKVKRKKSATSGARKHKRRKRSKVADQFSFLK